MNKQHLLGIYQTMVMIRRFEERMSQLFASGHIPGFLHLSIGQEAVAAGVCAHLRENDYITSTHRGHGHCIAKGANVKKMMAELFGKQTGYCKGKGGSMHVADVDIGILGANGIVGAGLPIAVGAALSAKSQGNGQVAVSFFGEGASGSGYFHEALNMAAVLKLPIIFLCESNQYAEFTSRSTHLPVLTVAERSKAYGLEGFCVDGNNALEVFEKLSFIIETVRAGNGPVIVECFTNRWTGHYEGDPQRYRPEGEVQEWKKKDPILALEKVMTNQYKIVNPQLEEIRKFVEKELDEAEQFSKNSPLPQGEETLEDVYAATSGR
ncbi:thiamine pyrophosphate-dependent dehydrogenase E1 component subunit alpha [Jeotgalibacillus soli]|uniref:thiamine pyrophosphate-dependent dehydrogenase E1 component subunit alpha n=1 Tax=Jeotgalibacillus soli TaxID=889306 RepID=UPI001F32963B|nr:thiamine pyrophosphate-dependent dehydrogenase E1 component subunit alpha [Jeotgalibacillus soli]